MGWYTLACTIRPPRLPAYNGVGIMRFFSPYQSSTERRDKIYRSVQ